MDCEEIERIPLKELVEFPSGYFHCLSCETAGKAVFDPQEQLKHFCPYCMGPMMFYAYDWEMVRRDNPRFPVIPVEGKVYPLRHYPIERD